MTEAVDTGRTGLGEFLRSRRERLTPRDAGLPERPRRRTPGLRREEVAELAGIGVDWYVRLEQGRTVSPSSDTVEALARALRLDDTERRHLRTLARQPVRRGPFVREAVPESVTTLITSLDRPAYVVGRRWDVLAWNDATVDWFTDYGDRDDVDRNVLVYLLLDPDARRTFGATWSEEAHRAVARFRAAHDRWAGDPAFAELAERLRDGCPEFAGWWERHDIARSGSGQKVLHHPRHGVRRFAYATFRPEEEPALRVSIYTPLGPS